MSRFKKFLYAYFSVILGFVVLSILGAKTVGGEMSLIEYFLTDLQGFGCLTLALFIISLFL